MAHSWAVAGVDANDGSMASARAVKSSTASDWASAGTGQACSPPTRSRSLLVTSTFRPVEVAQGGYINGRTGKEMLDVVEHEKCPLADESRGKRLGEGGFLAPR